MSARSDTSLRAALGALLAGSLAGAPADQEPASFLPVSLDAASLNRFWIDANPRVSFQLRAERRDLRLVFKDPRGMAWEITAADEEPGLDRPLYRTTLEQPTPGPWTLSILAPGAPSTATLEITYANQVRPRLTCPGTTTVSGSALIVYLELLDHSGRVKQLSTLVTLTRTDAEALPDYVALHDDGTHEDRIARDGLYTAVLPTQVPGTFRFVAQIEGTASGGRCQRTATWIYRVIPKDAELTGRVTQRLLVGPPD
jgi:hypothetical protein